MPDFARKTEKEHSTSRDVAALLPRRPAIAHSMLRCGQFHESPVTSNGSVVYNLITHSIAYSGQLVKMEQPYFTDNMLGLRHPIQDPRDGFFNLLCSLLIDMGRPAEWIRYIQITGGAIECDELPALLICDRLAERLLDLQL